jgi:hypothetical protein
MRLHVGELSEAEETSPEAQSWQAIHAPATQRQYRLAAAAGLVLLTGLCGGLGTFSALIGGGGWATVDQSALSWPVTVAVLLLYIPLHESLHLVGQPDWGRSSRSVVVLWPARLRFGAYYEGCMPRRRWLRMRLAPFTILSILPAGLLALSQVHPLPAALQIGLFVLLVVNTLGSGGDILAAWLVLAQVPASGLLCFRAGRAYWQPADG